ncbi:hypothetical protein TEA_005993 [Camellia sinensis var. sinensis]|uniref:Kinesin motor domain-containing protein n=2 Tax=Camellia sinensis TaxID=4442 RepID=A0A4S4D7T2_CAMSN|nr:hypothetical protein TEA_005993 [Camellia sinensis var. sinensis]
MNFMRIGRRYVVVVEAFSDHLRRSLSPRNSTGSDHLCTVFAYGQTNSGKTHTMRGSTSEPGVIPHADMDREFLLRMSYMEIYNEEINDLLAPEHRKLQIHESLERGIFVARLKEEIVASPEQILELMEFAHRHIGETNMNLYSSRSHTIFRMIIESKERSEDEDSGSSCDAIRVSVLNLVDLAGSERAAKMGAEGVRLKEGSHINKSLMTLGTVIKKLSEGAESQGYGGEPSRTGQDKHKYLNSIVHAKASAVKPMRSERDMGPLLPFEELVDDASMDNPCKPKEECNNNTVEDCTLPDSRALLHVTNRKKAPLRKKSLLVENSELEELQAEYEDLLLKFETQKIMSEIEVDSLTRKLAEADLCLHEKCNAYSTYHLDKSTIHRDATKSLRESEAILVIKQLQEKINMLEVEKSSSQQNLDCVVELATEQNICATEKYEELYEELLNAREEARIACEQLTSVESVRTIDEDNFDSTIKLLLEVQEITSEVQNSRNLAESVSLIVDELFQSFSAILNLFTDFKSLACDNSMQLKSIISNHERLNHCMKHKVNELENEKLLLHNQSVDHHSQIQELSQKVQDSDKALSELSEQHDLEKSELLSQIRTLEKEISCLSSSSLAREKEILRKDLEKTKTKLRETESKLKNAIQEKTKLEGEKACAERELKKLHAQKFLQRDISKRESLAGRKRDSIIDRSSNVFDPRRAKGLSVSYDQTFQDEYKKLEVLAFEMETTIASLEEELATANEEKEMAISRSQSLASDLQALSDNLNMSNSKMNTLEEEISDLLNSIVHAKASAVKPMRPERDMGPLLPFEELVDDASMDNPCKPKEECNNNTVEDCTLPDSRALLHVTNRKKAPLRKKSLLVENNELEELQAEYEDLLLKFETQKIMSEIEVDSLTRKLAEADLCLHEKCNAYSTYHLDKSTIHRDATKSLRESEAILVIKQLQEKINMLEVEKSSSQQNLDCVVELATEQNICATEKYEELYEELLNAREEARIACEQLTSVESVRTIDEDNFDSTIKLLLEVQEITSEVQNSRNLAESVSLIVDELFQSFSAILNLFTDFKSLACDNSMQLKSIISNHERLNHCMKHKVNELENEKLLLHNQSVDLHSQIQELSQKVQDSDKALSELSEQHDLEKSELLSQIRCLEKEISCLSSSSLAREKEILRKDLEKTKTKLRETESKLKNAIQEKTKLEGEKACAERELKKLHAQKSLQRDISKRESLAGRKRDSIIDRSSNVFDPRRAKGLSVSYDQTFQVKKWASIRHIETKYIHKCSLTIFLM